MKRLHEKFCLYATAAGLALSSTVALAGEYPVRPITMVVPYGAGGPSDGIARIIADGLQRLLGQPVIVENKPGAGSIIGVDSVAKTAADGYTILISTGAPFVINPFINAELPYKVSDFQPVSTVAAYTMVLATGVKQPFQTVTDLVEYAKANPGKLTFASAGNGTSNHLAGELLKSITGTQMIHVPYRGNASGMTDVIAGNVSVMFDMPATTMPHVESGRVRLLGSTGSERSAVTPDLPTINEAGVKGYEVTSWYGVMAPAKTPGPVVQKLSQSIAKVLEEPSVREKIEGLGYEVKWTSPEDLSTMIKEESSLWASVISKAGIQVQ